MTDPSDMQRHVVVGFLLTKSLPLKIHRFEIKIVIVRNMHFRSSSASIFALSNHTFMQFFFLSYLPVVKSKNVFAFSSPCHLKQTVY